MAEGRTPSEQLRQAFPGEFPDLSVWGVVGKQIGKEDPGRVGENRVCYCCDDSGIIPDYVMREYLNPHWGKEVEFEPGKVPPEYAKALKKRGNRLVMGYPISCRNPECRMGYPDEFARMSPQAWAREDTTPQRWGMVGQKRLPRLAPPYALSFEVSPQICGWIHCDRRLRLGKETLKSILNEIEKQIDAPELKQYRPVDFSLENASSIWRYVGALEAALNREELNSKFKQEIPAPAPVDIGVEQVRNLPKRTPERVGNLLPPLSDSVPF